MALFLILLAKIAPLYFIILVGYLVGRFVDINRETIAKILIYTLAPVVIFNGTFTAKISIATLALPFVFLGIGSSLCAGFYCISKYISLPDAEKRIIAFASGTANTGYFGLPVAIAIFGHDIIPIAVLSSLGTVLFESTIGFFIMAKGSCSTKNSLKRLAKLPNIYACIAGLVFNLLHINLGSSYAFIANSFLNSYLVLGMLLIGLGISNISKIKFDYRFNLILFFIKFIAWPALTLLFITIANYLVPGFFSSTLMSVMLFMSIVPLATNTIVYTTFFNLYPEKTALVVLLSTLWSIIYIPIMIALFH